MSEILKFMVYNPLRGKPKVFHDDYKTALIAAQEVNKQSNEDVFVLKIVAKIESKIIQETSEAIGEIR